MSIRMLFFEARNRQSGAALIITLIMLTLALVLGLSSYQGSRTEESMAGNQRALSQARMAAEYGVSTHWRDAVNSGGGVGETFVLSDDDVAGYSLLDPDQGLLQGIGYRFKYEVVSNSVLSGLPGGTPRGVYRMSSTGALISPEGDFLSTTTLEALGYSYGSGFLGLSPITSAASICGFEPGQGEKFTIEGELKEDGTRNPAIAVPELDDEEFVEKAIADQGDTEKYEAFGGVASPLSESLLRDANLFHQFIEAIKAEANTFPNAGRLNYGRRSPLGTLENPVVAYVDGDVTGNQGSFYGAGVLLIDGNANFNGTPSFSGLIIVLGDYTVDGGGGGPIEGSVLVAPYSPDEEGGYEFDCANIDFGGGGNTSYRYEPEALGVAFEELGAAASFWETNNESTSKPPGIYLHSWSESLD